MENQSVLNDAIAIVAFQIILTVFAMGISTVELSPTGSRISLWFSLADLPSAPGSNGFWCAPSPGWVDQPLVHITLTLVGAYGAFIVADQPARCATDQPWISGDDIVTLKGTAE